jgi:hypothetical protein
MRIDWKKQLTHSVYIGFGSTLEMAYLEDKDGDGRVIL